MTDYRIYTRSATIFDGATPEAAIYSQQGFQFSTAATGAVGLFSAASLGRKAASLINVFSDNTAVGGDLVEILSPNGAIRSSAAFTPQGTGWLFANPNDSVRITTAGAGQAEIFVNDLSDEQALQYSVAGPFYASQILYPSALGTNVAKALDGLLDLAVPLTVSNAVAGATVLAPTLSLPWQPVAVNFTQHGAIELPPLSSVPENFAYLFYRADPTGSAGLVEVIPNGTDLIDGRSLVGNPVNGGAYLSVRSAVSTPLIVRATAGTWVTSGGFIASLNDTFSAVAPATLGLWTGHRFVSISAAAPIVVTLPVVANVAGQGIPRGCRLTVWTTTAGPHTIAAGAGTTIWGSVNGVNYSGAASVPIAAGQTVTMESFSSLIWLVH